MRVQSLKCLKATPENFLRGRHNYEGVGVGSAHQRFEVRQLCGGYSHHQHFTLLLRIHALAVQGSDAAASEGLLAMYLPFLKWR